MNQLLSDLAARVQGALRPLASPLTIRRTETIRCVVATPAAAGATMLQLTVPAGTAGLLTGDSFTAGGTALKTVAADAPATGATCTVTFAPSLTAALPAGALIQVNRTAAYPCLGWEEGLDLVRVQNTLIGATDTSLCVLTAGLPIDPRAGDFIVSGGRTFTIKIATRDGMAAVWRLIAGT
ncbi:hypothetical protein AZL_022030 [Azospirillum sp. B510]|uniref:hypothetical protein n=1 Tax=Azospirillum sp. (strain B510) TaxID=137722 RepID=UPI0001C4BEF8|nr:hypothetical protein [Azospirillum sp. B510]BAI72841.1 hypothetical protein AZL_022030 [Azospirillum sp. B510]